MTGQSLLHVSWTVHVLMELTALALAIIFLEKHRLTRALFVTSCTISLALTALALSAQDPLSGAIATVMQYSGYIAYGILWVSAFVDRPKPVSGKKFQIRVSHILLFTVYLAIILGYGLFLHWSGLGLRHDRTMRFLKEIDRATPGLIICAAAAVASVCYWQRCPRAFRYVLASSVLGVLGVLLQAAGRVQVYTLSRHQGLIDMASFANLVSTALLFCGIFAGRGVQQRMAQHLYWVRFSQLKPWIPVGAIVLSTFLPWMSSTGPVKFSLSRPFNNETLNAQAAREDFRWTTSYRFAGRTSFRFSCNAWRTSFRLGPFAIQLGLAAVGCAVVAAIFDQRHGLRPLRWPALIAALAGTLFLASYLLILLQAPNAQAGSGLLIGFLILNWQLIAAWFVPKTESLEASLNGLTVGTN